MTQAGERAGLLRRLLHHACDYYITNKGCDLRLIRGYLDHKQI